MAIRDGAIEIMRSAFVSNLEFTNGVEFLSSKYCLLREKLLGYYGNSETLQTTWNAYVFLVFPMGIH